METIHPRCVSIRRRCEEAICCLPLKLLASLHFVVKLSVGNDPSAVCFNQKKMRGGHLLETIHPRCVSTRRRCEEAICPALKLLASRHFVVKLSVGNDPSTVCFNQKMRGGHLLSCIEAACLTPLPRRQRKGVQFTDSHTPKMDIECCICAMSLTFDSLVECTECFDMYHESCTLAVSWRQIFAEFAGKNYRIFRSISCIGVQVTSRFSA